MLLPFLIIVTLGYAVFAFAWCEREIRDGVGGTSGGVVDEDGGDDGDGGDGELWNGGAQHSAGKFILIGAAPVVATVMMVYLFLIVGGATTVQFNVGSESRMSAWSTWVQFWPLFLISIGLSALGALCWVLATAFTPAKRRSVPAAVVSLLYATLAFFTVASHFPSA